MWTIVCNRKSVLGMLRPLTREPRYDAESGAMKLTDRLANIRCRILKQFPTPPPPRFARDSSPRCLRAVSGSRAVRCGAVRWMATIPADLDAAHCTSFSPSSARSDMMSTRRARIVEK